MLLVFSCRKRINKKKKNWINIFIALTTERYLNNKLEAVLKILRALKYKNFFVFLIGVDKYYLELS